MVTKTYNGMHPGSHTELAGVHNPQMELCPSKECKKAGL